MTFEDSADQVAEGKNLIELIEEYGSPSDREVLGRFMAPIFVYGEPVELSDAESPTGPPKCHKNLNISEECKIPPDPFETF